MVAAADRDVPGGIRSGANSQSATASTRPIVHAVPRSVTCWSPGSEPGLPRGRHTGRMGAVRTCTTRGDDVTEPGTPSDVPDADRAEQEALLEAPAVGIAGDAAPPAEDVPEADAIEQQLAARPGETGSPLRPVGDREADDADVLEQEADVPVDDDDIVT
jgi:hypothetical protein